MKGSKESGLLAKAAFKYLLKAFEFPYWEEDWPVRYFLF
jgi:hypothetical protein